MENMVYDYETRIGQIELPEFIMKKIRERTLPYIIAAGVGGLVLGLIFCQRRRVRR